MNKADLTAMLKHIAVSIEMVRDGIVIAKLGLTQNPSKEQRRQLLEDRLELEAKLQRLNGKLLSLATSQTGMQPPTPEQIEEIKSLSAEVETATNESLNASAAINITSNVLDKATAILS